MDGDNIQTLTNTNIDLLVLSVGLLLIGLLLGISLSSLSKKKKEEKEVKEVAKTLDKPIDEKKPMTLLEKLKEKTVNIDNPILEEKSKRKYQQKRKLKNKRKRLLQSRFSKGLKEHDPDDDKVKKRKI